MFDCVSRAHEIEICPSDVLVTIISEPVISSDVFENERSMDFNHLLDDGGRFRDTRSLKIRNTPNDPPELPEAFNFTSIM